MQETSKQSNGQTVRRLLIFQVKLAIDAIRDILLSPVSLVLTLADLVTKREGENSYFEKLMAFGRNTEKRINLFEQHSDEETSVDSILQQVESVIVKEYKEKHLSKKTYSAIDNIIKRPKG